MDSAHVVSSGFLKESQQIGAIADDVGLGHRPIKSLAMLGDHASPSAPVCFFFRAEDPASEAMLGEVRLSGTWSNLPAIAAVTDPWSANVSRIFNSGVDDFVPLSELAQLGHKLIAVRSEGTPGGSYLSGKVVVADPDRARRVHLARHLRKIGLLVEFAVDASLPDDPGVKLVFAHCLLPPDGAAVALQQFREGPGARIPWIVGGTREELQNALNDFEEHENIFFFDVDADPAQIVSTANQVLIGKGRALRRSERLDFGTPVRVRLHGSDIDLWGFSYNINLGGLYIRTLTPPALGAGVDLEFLPPNGVQRVTVEAKVVWRQEFSRSRGYPAGFGIQYAESTPKEISDALDAGYEHVLKEKEMNAELATQEVRSV